MVLSVVSGQRRRFPRLADSDWSAMTWPTAVARPLGTRGSVGAQDRRLHSASICSSRLSDRRSAATVPRRACRPRRQSSASVPSRPAAGCTRVDAVGDQLARLVTALAGRLQCRVGGGPCGAGLRWLACGKPIGPEGPPTGTPRRAPPVRSERFAAAAERRSRDRLRLSGTGGPCGAGPRWVACGQPIGPEGPPTGTSRRAPPVRSERFAAATEKRQPRPPSAERHGRSVRRRSLVGACGQPIGPEGPPTGTPCRAPPVRSERFAAAAE